VYNKIIDMLYVTIEIQQEESIFYQIGQYVAEQEELNEKKLMHVQGFTKGQERSYHFFSHFDEQETSPKPQLSVLPQAGTKQIVNFKGKKIWVARKKRKSDDGTGVGNGLSGMNLDLTSFTVADNSVIISMRGRNVEELKSILQQWIDNIYYRDYNKLTVYQCMRIHFTDYGWKRISNKEMRNFESIVLREGQKEEILADVKKFLGAHKKYAMRGIPYRHAVILHGPPGTGKTSFIKGLAEKLKLNIAYISLVTSLDDDGFLSMLARVPANSVIVMEDFDRSHITEDAKESERNTGMVGAGLLNALDGINTPEGTLVFLTCNDITKINTAIKRPGRVDQIYHLDYADDYQIKEMLWRFFGKGEQTVNPEARKDNPHLQHIAEVFVSHARTTNHEKLTTATLQKFFL
ncbi:P-loop containing nucleoside triphosphate hydrolase protein, partial [Phascolomyces articulosus]